MLEASIRFAWEGKFAIRGELRYPETAISPNVSKSTPKLSAAALNLAAIPPSRIICIFSLRVIKVPGVFEIPITISKNIKKYDGFVALGCVIKGETPHFNFISSSSTQAIMNISVDSKKPIGNGIITCLNMKQARARRKKGKEAAKAVISVLSQ